MAAAVAVGEDENNFPFDVQFKVALVGHSQLPRQLNVDHRGVVVRSFRAPGARANEFQNIPRLQAALAWPHDLTILWLGSNDVRDHSQPDDIANTIQAIVTTFERERGSEVAIVLLEPRRYDPRLGISPRRYRLISNGINQRLIRRNRSRDTIHFSARPFVDGLSRDGVHFGPETRIHVNRKLESLIKKKAHAFFLLRSLGGTYDNPVDRYGGIGSYSIE